MQFFRTRLSAVTLVVAALPALASQTVMAAAVDAEPQARGAAESPDITATDTHTGSMSGMGAADATPGIPAADIPAAGGRPATQLDDNAPAAGNLSAASGEAAVQRAAGYSDRQVLVGGDDLVAVAAEDSRFSTLIEAVKAAGLLETLQTEGPFTVFAPTDAAFAELPEGTLDELLKVENKDRLAAILKHHLLAGEISSAQAAELEQAATVQGDLVIISSDDEGVTIDGARLVGTEIEASNGVIHVIDKVILPTS